jgi:hypothetical protein
MGDAGLANLSSKSLYPEDIFLLLAGLFLMIQGFLRGLS